MSADKLYAEFGRLVREHRRRLQLTQAQLAKHVGLTRTSITNIERGRQKILLHQLFSIADSLQVSPEALLPTVMIPEVAARIEEKLGKLLKDVDERAWAHRIVVSGSKGGTLNATSKD